MSRICRHLMEFIIIVTIINDLDYVGLRETSFSHPTLMITQKKSERNLFLVAIRQEYMLKELVEMVESIKKLTRQCRFGNCIVRATFCYE